jgi:hypothetical protein
MKKRYLKKVTIALLLMATLLFVGCRTAPIYSVTDAPVNVNVENHTAADVKKAILRAGAGLGWHIKESGPGKLVGTLHLRKHMAKIDIPYSKDGYSLLYSDSNELNYNPDKGEIHKNYNGWVQNLDNAIQSHLMGL